MKILLISDAWQPQINGVVRTLNQTAECLRASGHIIEAITPDLFRNFPCPTYPEIRLAWLPARKIKQRIKEFSPDAIHIATEGPLGLATRNICVRHNIPFTTAYHTRFPEYMHTRFRTPLSWSYRFLRWFHHHSKNVMTPTPSIRQTLIDNKFTNTALWGRGVDTQRFYPTKRNAFDIFCPNEEEKQAPKFVYIGRVSVEKNIEAFLELDLPGSKWIIGDGPARSQLEKNHPEAHFLGALPQEKLPPFYNAADVFVFPSKTDTFGLVLLEAMACGTPVAAYPVTGPIDVVTNNQCGILDHNLKQACLKALELKRKDAANFGAKHSWEKSTEQFFTLLNPFNTELLKNI